MHLNIEGILNGERLAITRALSFVENSSLDDMALIDELYGHLGKAYRIGITGPPGAGKSSLVDRLIQQWRSRDKRVAVISVDPTSPFTGGAILGDRVRMGRHYSDRKVFIRSMATRGSQGGLALRAQDAADVFDAAGYDIIIYETVGVGQVELDVAQAADTTLVILVPESGDDIQAMKAGLMEIADIFVINKADRQGANQSYAQIRSMLEMRPMEPDMWSSEVVKTSALQDEGVSGLMEQLGAHHDFLEAAGEFDRKKAHRVRRKLAGIIEGHVLNEFWSPNRKALLDALRGEGRSEKPSDIVRSILDRA